MWRLLGAILIGALAVSGALAQGQIGGRVIDLVFATEALVFKVEDLGGLIIGVKETETETRIQLPSDILFDFDKSDIRASAETALKQAADMIRKDARGTVVIEGHTDSKGTPVYNQRLSERRAQSVQKWLVERESLRGTRFAPKGFGSTRPVAPNTKPDGSDDPEGRQKNRRVEIVFSRR
jgi:outer membrane protein OmpA-like peptidoglycan-associated protein